MQDSDLQAMRVAELRDFIGQEVEEDLCRTLLEENSWSVEATVRQFFEAPRQRTSATGKNANADDGDSPDEEDSMGDEEDAFLFQQYQANAQEEEDEDDAPSAATAAAAAGFGGVRARRRVSPDNSMDDGDRVHQQQQSRRVAQAVPAFSLYAFVKEALCGAQDASNANAAAARKFSADFDRIVGPSTPVPQFFESSFEDALFSATTERKMLCIYLHSPSHPASDKFCKNVVCSRAVLQALHDVRVWGGSVETCDGYLASSKLQCAAFPAIVLVSGVEGGRDARIVDRIYFEDGGNEAERIAGRITAARNVGAMRAPAMAQPPQQLQQQRQNAFELEERRRILQEQDEALRRAMEEDRQRIEAKRAQEEAEEAERLRQIKAAEEEARKLQEKRASLLPEPAAVGGGGGEQICTLRFNLPGGQKWARKFLATDTIGYVRLVLDCHFTDVGIKIARFGLSTNFPKRTFEDEQETLLNAGLSPQAALFVQDLDA